MTCKNLKFLFLKFSVMMLVIFNQPHLSATWAILLLSQNNQESDVSILPPYERTPYRKGLGVRTDIRYAIYTASSRELMLLRFLETNEKYFCADVRM